ncbi:MAG: 50S ribosomal protein L4 [Rhodospirillales bacterium]|nr:50S ribosomal protein L4 [Rhodospirillales bacterium]MBI2977729.1 50S ribosomal protein L4 [Rhodospirillales bacterium]
MQCDVINLANKKTGTIELDDGIFGIAVRPDILQRAVQWQLAKRRAGTAKTKERGEVQATTKKPFKQKGTGRARQGSRVAPQMRGGGTVFGPRVRSFAQGLPKKIRKLALKTALSAKRAEGKLVVLDEAKLGKAKTSELAKQLKKLNWGRTLVIDGAEVDANFARAATNLGGIDVLPSQGANVYDILRRDTLVLTKDGVQRLVERLK